MIHAHFINEGQCIKQSMKQSYLETSNFSLQLSWNNQPNQNNVLLSYTFCTLNNNCNPGLDILYNTLIIYKHNMDSSEVIGVYHSHDFFIFSSQNIKATKHLFLLTESKS